MADQAITIAQETAVHDPQPWRLLPHDRGKHVLVLGVDREEKQNLLWNMMVQDIEAGAGVAVIDVSGNFGHRLLQTVPASRVNNTLYFDLGDQTSVAGFNPFYRVPLSERSRAAQGFMALFVAVWSLTDDSHPLMLRLMRHSARALLDSQEGTLLGMYALLTNADYRRRIVAQCQDGMTRRFWADFDTWSADDQRDKPQPVLTRLEAFLSDPDLRAVLGQTKSTLDLNRVVDQKQVLVADLPRHQLGPETAKLFASLLATRLQTILESRAAGWPFYLYLPDADHVHIQLAARAIASRFVNGGVVAGVQQLVGHEHSHRSALLGAERIITFRAGPDDARLMAGRFPMPQAETTLTTLSRSRLAISGEKYELQSMPRWPANHGGAQHIKRRSKNILGVPKQQVTAKIDRFLDSLGEQ